MKNKLFVLSVLLIQINMVSMATDFNKTARSIVSVRSTSKDTVVNVGYTMFRPSGGIDDLEITHPYRVPFSNLDHYDKHENFSIRTNIEVFTDDGDRLNQHYCGSLTVHRRSDFNSNVYYCYKRGSQWEHPKCQNRAIFLKIKGLTRKRLILSKRIDLATAEEPFGLIELDRLPIECNISCDVKVYEKSQSNEPPVLPIGWR